ncbi:hypothetical protein GQX73_g3435 [Xylaria multiplex]|uniref:Nephrocystin 3-like N-terminal domain-containing protein n=1 Tax=Xylaria multiplex TaxID=323545 RepID=A0A7C8IVG5_9PEZI|nr:hypothetical protein GQX73_g3435 [Xylaria multiplex]
MLTAIALLSDREIFDEAHQEFLDALSERDRARFPLCCSPDDLLQAITSVADQATQGKRRRLNRFLSLAQKLNGRLQPFFDAVNVIIAASSVAAAVYGSFRIAIQLAAGLPSFFEKTIAVVEHFAESFPQYGALAKLFEGQPPTRIRQHLRDVYKDIFEFLRVVTRIFTASNGKIRRPPALIATTIWTPFEAKFGQIINRLNSHRNFISEEIEILQLEKTYRLEQDVARERQFAKVERQEGAAARQKLNEIAGDTSRIEQAQAEEAKKLSVKRLLEWLDPPHFAEEFDSSKRVRQEGTATWLLDDPQFLAWRDTIPTPATGITDRKKMPPWVLWINGNPGWGKTILAAAVLDDILSEISSPDNYECLYYFFSFRDPARAGLDSAYRAALAQLLHRHRDDLALINMFLFMKLDVSGSGQMRASLNEVESLIQACATQLGGLNLILDGIDEAIDAEGLTGNLKNLTLASPIKLLCFSRPNVHALQRLVLPNSKISLTRARTSTDIEIYLHSAVESLVEDGMIYTDDNARLVNHLLCGADGMFLWAKLMIGFLSSPVLTPEARLHTIFSVTLPEGLEGMYERILTQICGSRVSEQDLARKTLNWMINSIGASGGSYLRELRSYVSNDNINYETQSDQDFANIVTTVCQGLIEYRPTESLRFSEIVFQCDSPRIAFVHHSVHQYFINVDIQRSATFSKIVLDAIPAQVELTTKCLQHIIKNAPKIAPSRFTGSWQGGLGDRSKRDKFEAYCVRYWVDHLSQTMRDSWNMSSASYVIPSCSNLVLVLIEFLKSPMALVSWIEGIYTLQQCIESKIEMLQRWMRSVTGLNWSVTSLQISQLIEPMSAFALELKELEQEWGTRLLATPSVSIFPAGSIPLPSFVYIIWDDVTIFQKPGILSRIAQVSSTRPMTCLTAAKTSLSQAHASKKLCTVSKTAEDGSLMAVLGVWPSLDFEKMANGLATATDSVYQNIEHCSDGWVARYELWSVQDRTCRRTYRIDLDPTEVQLLLRQSFRQDMEAILLSPIMYASSPSTIAFECAETEKKFNASFPLSIAYDCMRFAVLRTIYQLPDNPLTCKTKPTSTVLPLQSLPHYNEKWTTNGLPIYNPPLNPLSDLPKYSRALIELSLSAIRDWYAYSISFDSKAKYIVFCDYQKPCITHIAVFCISSESELMLELVRSVKSSIPPPRPKCETFHPSRTLLAFSAGYDIWIWDFGIPTSLPIIPKSQKARCRPTGMQHLWSTNRTVYDDNPADGETNSTFQLLSVPESFAKKNTSISIFAPDLSSNTITMTINKTTTKAYDVRGEADDHCPAIIDRNIASIGEKIKPLPMNTSITEYLAAESIKRSLAVEQRQTRDDYPHYKRPKFIEDTPE